MPFPVNKKQKKYNPPYPCAARTQAHRCCIAPLQGLPLLLRSLALPALHVDRPWRGVAPPLVGLDPAGRLAPRERQRPNPTGRLAPAPGRPPAAAGCRTPPATLPHGGRPPPQEARAPSAATPPREATRTLLPPSPSCAPTQAASSG